MKEPVRIRWATEEDSAFILAVHNEPTVRAASFSTAQIGLEEHARWMDAILNDPRRTLGIILKGNEAVGVVRSDARGPVIELSLALTLAARGNGVGSKAIIQATHRASATYPGKPVVAQIKPGNFASIYAFQKAGFVMVRDEGDALQFEWRP